LLVLPDSPLRAWIVLLSVLHLSLRFAVSVITVVGVRLPACEFFVILNLHLLLHSFCGCRHKTYGQFMYGSASRVSPLRIPAVRPQTDFIRGFLQFLLLRCRLVTHFALRCSRTGPPRAVHHCVVHVVATVAGLGSSAGCWFVRADVFAFAVTRFSAPSAVLPPLPHRYFVLCSVLRFTVPTLRYALPRRSPHRTYLGLPFWRILGMNGSVVLVTALLPRCLYSPTGLPVRFPFLHHMRLILYRALVACNTFFSLPSLPCGSTRYCTAATVWYRLPALCAPLWTTYVVRICCAGWFHAVPLRTNSALLPVPSRGLRTCRVWVVRLPAIAVHLPTVLCRSSGFGSYLLLSYGLPVVTVVLLFGVIGSFSSVLHSSRCYFRLRLLCCGSFPGPFRFGYFVTFAICYCAMPSGSLVFPTTVQVFSPSHCSYAHYACRTWSSHTHNALVTLPCCGRSCYHFPLVRYFYTYA
jgi:hypothetical protein